MTLIMMMMIQRTPVQPFVAKRKHGGTVEHSAQHNKNIHTYVSKTINGKNERKGSELLRLWLIALLHLVAAATAEYDLPALTPPTIARPKRRLG